VVDEFGDLVEAVDIGCGRGEWLAMLKQCNVSAQGIDLNQVMIDHCLAQGHQAKQADALAWMQQQGQQSLHLISSFHVIEHIPFQDYYLWFEQFSRILAPGGVLILETPNPENLLVASHTFYHDPTHLNPITPTLLEFTAKFFGLQVLAIERLNPYPESAKVTGYDELTQRVNGHLCGPQDFGLIAYKPRPEVAS
jgi:O-antigen chain-terminating methyltransferase